MAGSAIADPCLCDSAYRLALVLGRSKGVYKREDQGGRLALVGIGDLSELRGLVVF